VAFISKAFNKTERNYVSQMVTYLFVIEELGVVSTSRAYKAKIRRVTKDVVKSEV